MKSHDNQDRDTISPSAKASSCEQSPFEPLWGTRFVRKQLVKFLNIAVTALDVFGWLPGWLVTRPLDSVIKTTVSSVYLRVQNFLKLPFQILLARLLIYHYQRVVFILLRIDFFLSRERILGRRPEERRVKGLAYFPGTREV